MASLVREHTILRKELEGIPVVNSALCCVIRKRLLCGHIRRILTFDFDAVDYVKLAVAELSINKD